MQKIKQITAKEILDSRGNPTIEATLVLEDGSTGTASIPSGASTGEHEACELRDGDMERYNGKGVLKAVSNIEEIISPTLIGKEFDQKGLDQTLIDLDGTPQKTKLGANAILAISLAFAKAKANSMNVELHQYFATLGDFGPQEGFPVPMFNILNGGRHANNGMAFQEFMIVPKGAQNPKEALEWGEKIYEVLKSELEKRGLSTELGDEGGFAPKLESHIEALDLLMISIKDAGFESGKDVYISLDTASSEFCRDGVYKLETGEQNTEEFINHLVSLTEKYPILSIEDGLEENDFEGNAKLTERLAGKTLTIGDDLYTTNKERLRIGIDNKATTGILIKFNQIGTVTETVETILLAKQNNIVPVISHRSGETMDTFITHASVGFNCPFLKSGAPSKPERLVKYEELIRIS